MRHYPTIVLPRFRNFIPFTAKWKEDLVNQILNLSKSLFENINQLKIYSNIEFQNPLQWSQLAKPEATVLEKYFLNNENRVDFEQVKNLEEQFIQLMNANLALNFGIIIFVSVQFSKIALKMFSPIVQTE